jgi:hypothetical protein
LLHKYSQLGTDFTQEFEQHLVASRNGRFRLEGNTELAPAMPQPQKEFYGRPPLDID